MAHHNRPRRSPDAPRFATIAEIPTAVLVRELNRRRQATADGKCDFCGQPFDSLPLCEHPSRHYRLGVPNHRGARP